MARGLDLASTIGTWVGAGIGIIALIGIVGPALIWYASTRDRQKLLNAIGRDNNNYLSRGVHVGPNNWLGQRVRAPMLEGSLSLGALDSLPSLKLDKLKTGPMETSWILFGSLLEAYGIPFQRGDQLAMKQGRAMLPIHPSWIFIIGLLGRYSDRKSQSGNSMKIAPRFQLASSRLAGPAASNGLWSQRHESRTQRVPEVMVRIPESLPGKPPRSDAYAWQRQSIEAPLIFMGQLER